MAESIQERWTPRNPLGVIALFVFLIETVATVSLHAVADKPYATVLVWFIVAYPIGIAASFFLMLWFKREALYGPMDYPDQRQFADILSGRITRNEEHIHTQQEIINAVRFVSEGVITKFEYDKLVGLEHEGPFLCYYCDTLMSEMKRLYDHGFVDETEFGSGPQMERQHRGSGQPFDLKKHFVLTERGKKYLQIRRQWQSVMCDSDGSSTSTSK